MQLSGFQLQPFATRPEKRGCIAVGSEGLADRWRGEYRKSSVTIRAFHKYPAQNLGEAEEVSIQPARGLLTSERFGFFGKECRCGRSHPTRGNPVPRLSSSGHDRPRLTSNLYPSSRVL